MLSPEPESRPPMHAVAHTFAQLAAAGGGNARSNISEPRPLPAEPPDRQGAGVATRSETVAPAASAAVVQDQPPATTDGSPRSATAAPAVAAASAAAAQDQPPATTDSSPRSATAAPAAAAASTAAAQDQPPTTTGGNDVPRQPATASEDGHIAPRPQRRYRIVVAAAALVAVLGVGILIAAMLPGLGRDADPQAGSEPSPSASASAPSSRSSTPSPTRSTEPSLSGSPQSSARPPSVVPSRKATSAPTVRGTPTAAQLRKAITSYYALMPGNTDQAWPRMTASYRANHAGGRQAYERFWDAIGRVVVSDVSGSPPGSAQATLTYYFKDGRVVTERTAYGLVNDGGTLKINSSSVLSSTTT
jgi:eukaryotic-like serine/threonine-protein kinase